MVSARMKAEQAQDAARKAAADAEIAMSTARQYSPASSQPGAPTQYCLYLPHLYCALSYSHFTPPDTTQFNGGVRSRRAV